ncbi:MAG: DUF4844 domain-containing protein [Oricola sp.]
MRTFLVLLAIALIALAGAVWCKYRSQFPDPSGETVQLDAEKRQALIRLRDEKKFGPHDYPPLGYTGIATPEEGVVARAAVNAVLELILSREDGPIPAEFVAELIGQAKKSVHMLETEDRDRTTGYLIEIWYLLGFKGATGRFAYGSAFPLPDGFGEPLPPGWTSPTEPRPIGESE